VKSTVETLSPTRVRLAIEVPFAELEPSMKMAYREISQQVNIPGFRQGRVPAAIIDQRFGRGAVLTRAVEEAIPAQIMAAVREHDVKSLGRPEVEITEMADGQPLRFTAELDVRPQITVPDMGTITVTVDQVQVGEDEIDQQLTALRERFATLKTAERAAQVGDYVQIDLSATVDGTEVPGGSASNVSHEVGSGQLVPGLDEVLAGMGAGESATFQTELVGGEYAGRQADVAVTVRGVKQKELPPLDDDFAGLASEFDTIDELRSDLRERLTRVRRVEQLYSARDKALDALVNAADVPAPAGVVAQEVESRKQAMADELERISVSMDDYLSAEGKTAEEVDTELTEAAASGVKVQLLLDTLADQEKLEVSDEEFGHEVVHRAQRAGVEVQKYYDQLVRSGMAATLFGDVRRGKALAVVLERVKIVDSAGEPVSLEEIRRGAGDADGEPHDHDRDHDHEHDAE
jgi:trigger factor